MMAAVEAETTKLPDLRASTEGKGIYEGKYVDRRPDLRAAGKLTFMSGESVPLCLTTPDRPPSPAVVRRFRDFYRSDHGQRTVFYGKANDPHLRWAKEMTHGTMTYSGGTAAEILNPHPKTLFQQRFADRQESCYASKKHRLGRIPDTAGKLPDGLDIYRNTFGIKTEKTGSAGELINPDRRPIDIQRQENVDHDTYLKSHRHFHPAEQLTRAYSSKFSIGETFGTKTPHRNDGLFTKNTLRWIGDDNAMKHDPLVSKRLDDFRERTQPQLGKVLDPIKDTLKVSEDHTFGILSRPDPYGVDDLLHGRAPRFYVRGSDRERGMVAAIRHQMKKMNYQHFPSLLAAFKAYDQDGKGKINKDDLRRVCQQFDLPLDLEILEQLLDYCDVDQDGKISWEEFSNFLNFRDKFPEVALANKRRDAPQSAPAVTLADGTPARIKKQIDEAIERWTTSNGMYNEAVHRVDSRRLRTYGIPTVRSDLAIPRYRRVSDHTTYGHEGDAKSVLQPSIFGSHGVWEFDMLGSRSKDELKTIFEAIGVVMTGDMFDETFAAAAAGHPRGEVSVESFRAVLDSLQASQLHQQIADQENAKLIATE